MPDNQSESGGYFWRRRLHPDDRRLLVSLREEVRALHRLLSSQNQQQTNAIYDTAIETGRAIDAELKTIEPGTARPKR